MAAEAIQHASRRVIEGLSPLHLEELGIQKSIQKLFQNAHSSLPMLVTASQVDPRLDSLDGLLLQTIYRIVQEAVANVIKHAQATRLNVEASVLGQAVTIEISDDGIGFPDSVSLGRGLTGMSDRIHALDGTLELLRRSDRTIVRCVLPVNSP